ncbi:AMP-binding protein [Paenibacillus harenae]|uniref:AMP-binding protein n=1 Tax=Paenibacillus harenae TaxID=306543 RepID=UPI00040916C8|nr:AMP-binding protein [Paenibacillus harenae]
MITVNTTRYDKSEMEAVHAMYQGLEHLARVEGRTLAVCCTDPIYTISLVLYFRRHAGSVLLIHGETPMDAAVTMAVDADCSGLIYGDPKHYIPLNRFFEENVLQAGICQFSSGTTGGAKLVRRTWQEVQHELEAYNEALMTDDDPTPVILSSVSHSYGLLSGVLSALERGNDPVIITHNNPKFALGLIRQTPRHLVYGVPLLLQAVTGLVREPVRFHRFISSGAPLPEALYRKLIGMTESLLQQYGCSEAGCISLSNGIESHDDMGYPLKHIAIEAGSHPSRPAEISVTAHGKVIRTQDLGYTAESGSLRFVSRADDVINVSGLKVYPVEVEECISRLEGIHEVVVYRGRHPVIGELVKASVVAASCVTPELVRDWCLQGLPPYKVPAHVEMVSDIPRTKNGKVSRRLLEMRDNAR